MKCDRGGKKSEEIQAENRLWTLNFVLLMASCFMLSISYQSIASPLAVLMKSRTAPDSIYHSIPDLKTFCGKTQRSLQPYCGTVFSCVADHGGRRPARACFPATFLTVTA